MRRTFRCKHCNSESAFNPRLKGKQKYCGKAECQNARKLAWDGAKRKKDAQYQKKQLLSKKQWRENFPAHEYQREYRSQHPTYVEENRKKQTLRNQKRLSAISSTVIDPHSFIVKFKNDGDCSISKVRKRLVIKSDALTQQVVDTQ